MEGIPQSLSLFVAQLCVAIIASIMNIVSKSISAIVINSLYFITRIS